MTADDPTFKRMFDIRSSTLDERGNRILEIELHAVLTHRDEVRRVLRADGPFELAYELQHGELVKKGTIDPERPELRLVFERGTDPHGAWEIRITGRAHGAKRERELWRQLLFVQTELRLDRDTIDKLARRYAPVFVFSSGERYFPVSLRTLLCDPQIASCNEQLKIKTIFGKEIIPLAQLGDFLRFNGHADYLLDFNFLSMRRSIFASLGGDPKTSTIYYSYLEDPAGGRFFINYHLLYAFDTKTGLARLTGIGPHVFDRESMVLELDANLEPRAMIISGHLEDQEVLLAKLKVWKQGRISVRFDDPLTLKIGTHPVVAVAEGSHALYPTSGVYHLSLLRELAGYLDPKVMTEDLDEGERYAIRPEQVLAPPSITSRELPRYQLVSLGLDRLCSRIVPDAEGYDGYNAFLAFSGYWVDVPGTQNARFPPFTRKEMEVVDWADGAFQWRWSDLPERYHHNNSIILRFLRENLEDL